MSVLNWEDVQVVELKIRYLVWLLLFCVWASGCWGQDNTPGNLAVYPVYGDNETYGDDWDGDALAPSKNAIYDKIESMSSGGNFTCTGLNSCSVTTLSDVSSAGSGSIITTVERSKLSGIENGATADQTGSEIVSLINAGTDLIDDDNIAASIARDSEVNAKVSDAAYGSSWNGVTDVAPSKNAVYDKLETVSGGYTNLTQFVDQGAWRLFYSNNLGDVKELAFGSSGQYLKSNGPAAAPSWDTPSGGSGDWSPLYIGVGATPAPVSGVRAKIDRVIQETQGDVEAGLGEIYSDYTYATLGVGGTFDSANTGVDVPATALAVYARNNNSANDVCGIWARANAETSSDVVFGGNLIVSAPTGLSNVKLVGLEIDVQPDSGTTAASQSAGLYINSYNIDIPGPAIQLGSVSGGTFNDGIVIDGVLSTGAGINFNSSNLNYGIYMADTNCSAACIAMQASTKIAVDGSDNLVFYDTLAGWKTLSQLAAGGGSGLWTGGGTYIYGTAEGGNTRLHDSGQWELNETGGTSPPLLGANRWGYSSDVTESGRRLLVLDGTEDETLTPAIWVEKLYNSDSSPTGDPTIPVGMYIAHKHTGSGTGFTHSLMAYAWNAGTGDNDCIALSGRTRKTGNGVGDSCGVWGSAYNEVNQNGGVMAMEAAIYQNVAGMTAGDRLMNKWSCGLHVSGISTGSPAKAGIAIDAANSYRFWNAMIIDKNCFGGAGITGTVGINAGSWDSSNYPQYGIKFGVAGTHLYCNSGDLKFYDPNTGTKTLSQLAASGGGMSELKDDTTPELGGDLYTLAHDIIFDNTRGIYIKDTGGNFKRGIALNEYNNWNIGADAHYCELGYNSSDNNPVRIRVNGVNNQQIVLSSDTDSSGKHYLVIN